MSVQLRHVSHPCAEHDVDHVRATLEDHLPSEYVGAAYDGDRVVAILDVGHLDPPDRACVVLRAERLVARVVSQHQAVPL